MVTPVQSVVRAMAVLTAFTEATPSLNATEVAQRTDLARGTAHRLLATLEQLGYVRNVNGDYELTHRVLEIGHGYLTSQPVPEIGRGITATLGAAVDEHVSCAVLDGHDALIIAATQVRRRISLQTHVGSRLPLATSASGRALLADLSPAEIRTLFNGSGTSAEDVKALVTEAALVADRGYSLSNKNLEDGMVSIGAPVRDASGAIVAAIAVASSTLRYRDTSLEDTVAEQLLAAAQDFGRALGFAPPIAV